MENSVIELHDSHIEMIQILPDRAEIIFSQAMLHRSQGVPGVDAGTVWAQPAVLSIRGCGILSTSVEDQVVSEGHLRLGQTQYPNLIPVPCSFEGPVEFAIVLADATSLILTGTQAELRFSGEPKYIEKFQ